MALLRAVAVALAWFLLVSFVSCNVLTAHYAKEFPHDGQDGLAGFLGGLNIGGYTSLVVFVVSWVVFWRRARR